MTFMPDKTPQPNEQILHEENSSREFTPKMNCSRCNASLLPDARFCNVCGLPVWMTTSNSTVADPSQFNQPVQFNQPPSMNVAALTPMTAPISLKKNSVIRLLTRPTTWRWGLVVIGLLLALGGSVLIYSAGSQSVMPPSQSAVTYKSVRGTIHFVGFTISAKDQNPTNTYYGLDDSQTFYYFNAKDFTPSPPDLKLDTDVAFIYRPDQSVDISQIFPGTTCSFGVPCFHLQGLAYKVVQVTVVNSNSQVFTSAEYDKYIHPNPLVGNTQINRGAGIAMVIVGLTVVALALAMSIISGRRGKKQAVLNVATVAATEMSVAVEMQPQTDPYEYPEPPYGSSSIR